MIKLKAIMLYNDGRDSNREQLFVSNNPDYDLLISAGGERKMKIKPPFVVNISGRALPLTTKLLPASRMDSSLRAVSHGVGT